MTTPPILEAPKQPEAVPGANQPRMQPPRAVDLNDAKDDVDRPIVLTSERAEHTIPMHYGAIRQIYAVSVEQPAGVGRGIPPIVYGLGYDGGVYQWHRPSKRWILEE